MQGIGRNWWVIVLRGVVAILFGVAVALAPAASLMVLVLAFGVYAFVGGGFAIGVGIADPQRRWELIGEGIIGVLAGLITFSRPGLTALALYGLIAAFAIVSGILQWIAAARLRADRQRGGSWLVLAGVLSVGFGVLLFALPRAGLMALAWLIAMYGITFGLTLIAFGLTLRSVGRVTRAAMPPQVPQPV